MSYTALVLPLTVLITLRILVKWLDTPVDMVLCNRPKWNLTPRKLGTTLLSRLGILVSTVRNLLNPSFVRQEDLGAIALNARECGTNTETC